jgi:Lon protease-like protein
MHRPVIELPLFPLRTVLFPGTPLEVHVFEERYKALIEDCVRSDAQFGVVLIREGPESGGPLPTPHRVGCTARIVEIEPLDDGRMNVTAVGVDRFRIASVRQDSNRTYLVGDVSRLELVLDDADEVARAADQLRRWVGRYLAVLTEASQGDYDFDARQLPDDPVALGYLAASILPVPPRQKQPLLTVDAASDLLADAIEVYRHELSLLENMVAHMHVTQAGPFSLN